MPLTVDSFPAESLDSVTDATQLRRVFGCYPSGVTAVCAQTEDGPVGMLVSSFTSVSLEPPLVSICIMQTSRTWSLLRTRPRLGISILGDGHDELCQRFSSRAEDKFAGLELTMTAEGAVLLPDTTAWLNCSIRDELPAGDHTIVLLRIESLRARPATAPLIFHGSRYHRLRA